MKTTRTKDNNYGDSCGGLHDGCGCWDSHDNLPWPYMMVPLSGGEDGVIRKEAYKLRHKIHMMEKVEKS